MQPSPTLGRTVADSIRAEMARRRLTQAALATSLGRNGAWVSRRLSGLVPLEIDDLAAIAEALQVSVARLLGDVAA